MDFKVFFSLQMLTILILMLLLTQKNPEKCQKGKGIEKLLFSECCIPVPSVENTDKYTSAQFTLFLSNKDMRT